MDHSNLPNQRGLTGQWRFLAADNVGYSYGAPTRLLADGDRSIESTSLESDILNTQGLQSLGSRSTLLSPLNLECSLPELAAPPGIPVVA
jgi:hypothetical protein